MEDISEYHNLKFTVSIMFWGGISMKGKTKLCIIEAFEHVNSEAYCQLTETYCITF